MRKFSEFHRLRLRAGLSVDEAALLIEASRRTVQAYERGDRRAPPLALRVLREAANRRALKEAAGQFRFIDLFAGIGGMRLGFEATGGRCVFTAEWDRYSQETYARNFRDNHPIEGDVRQFSAEPERIPEHDVLLAGFPCQPFSLAGVSKKNALGRPHGFLDDTQGTLFFDTAQIIKHHRPTAFLLENVKNLRSHDGGRTFATIMHVLQDELGYSVQARVVSSETWVPQKRERIFIVGFREECGFRFDTLDAGTPGRGPKLGSILQPNGEVDPKYTLTEKLWDYLQRYREKHAEAGNGFGCSVFGPDDVARTLSARYFKDGSEILIAQDGLRPRRLTPRECSRLMGFDRDGREFIIPVSDTQAYRQFGNSVVVPQVEAIARHMLPHLRVLLSESAGPSAETVAINEADERLVAVG